MTVVLTIAFLIVGCLIGYIYASRRFQEEKNQALRDLGLQKEEAQRVLAQQKEQLLKEAEQAKEQELRELGQQKEEAQKELARLKEELQKEAELQKKRTLEGSRAGIKGRVAENLALLIPDFQEQHPDLKISEARFTGEPIDYLFFEGIDEKNITKVIFLEVKSGKHPQLNPTEASLKNVIDDAETKGANVIWREYIVHEPEIQAIPPPEVPGESTEAPTSIPPTEKA